MDSHKCLTRTFSQECGCLFKFHIYLTRYEYDLAGNKSAVTTAIGWISYHDREATSFSPLVTDGHY